MDFTKIDLAQIISFLTTLSVIALGISDIRKRRAEAKKIDAESRAADMSADSALMSQIKQASVDLMLQLKADNKELVDRVDQLEKEVHRLNVKVECYKRLLRMKDIEDDCGTQPIAPIKK